MEQEQNTPTEDTQVDESQLNSAAGDEAETVATGNTDALSLAEINELTGMSYKDKETALKSIKDMKSQAGKAADLEGKLKTAMEAAGNGENAEVNELREKLNRLEQDAFYSQNPDVNRELAETIAQAKGITPQEAIESDLYKNTVATPEKRTVATPNNRVATPSEEFNPADHAGDATALAKYVNDTFILKS